MNQPKIFNSTGEKLNMNIIFSFTCKENGKNYVAIENHNDIFEIIKVKTKSIYISDIPKEEWELVKHALQYNVFAKMGN